MALFGTSCYEQRSVRDEFSGLMCVSKSDTTQKLKGQRVDGNEQRLHRSVGLLILAKSTRSRFIRDRQQPRISRSPWSGTRGSMNSIADLSEMRYNETRYRSAQRAKSSVNSIQQDRRESGHNCSGTANFTLATLEIDDVSRSET
jgi:hypothetical protein